MAELSRTPTAITISTASTAHSLPVRGQVEVGTAERVSVDTVRFPSVHRGHLNRTAPDVFPEGARLQVRGVHAMPDSAKVVKCCGLDWAYEDIEDHAMGGAHLPLPSDAPITLAKPARHPEPAPSLWVENDLCADARRQRVDRLRVGFVLHQPSLAAVRPSNVSPRRFFVTNRRTPLPRDLTTARVLRDTEKRRPLLRVLPDGNDYLKLHNSRGFAVMTGFNSSRQAIEWAIHNGYCVLDPETTR